jgi:hypothetical protein
LSPFCPLYDKLLRFSSYSFDLLLFLEWIWLVLWYTVFFLINAPSQWTHPLKPYKAKKNANWELIAFFLNNFFKKVNRKINALVHLLGKIRYIVFRFRFLDCRLWYIHYSYLLERLGQNYVEILAN